MLNNIIVNQIFAMEAEEGAILKKIAGNREDMALESRELIFKRLINI